MLSGFLLTLMERDKYDDNTKYEKTRDKISLLLLTVNTPEIQPPTSHFEILIIHTVYFVRFLTPKKMR